MAERPSSGGFRGSCDCGAVVLRIPGLPSEINDCPCSFCQRLGALWAYFPPGTVVVSGQTRIYRRATRLLAFHRCAVCGVLTHWTGPEGRATKMGVNMVNFACPEVAAVPVVSLG